MADKHYYFHLQTLIQHLRFFTLIKKHPWVSKQPWVPKHPRVQGIEVLYKEFK